MRYETRQFVRGLWAVAVLYFLLFGGLIILLSGCAAPAKPSGDRVAAEVCRSVKPLPTVSRSDTEQTRREVLEFIVRFEAACGEA